MVVVMVVAAVAAVATRRWGASSGDVGADEGRRWSSFGSSAEGASEPYLPIAVLPGYRNMSEPRVPGGGMLSVFWHFLTMILL